MRSWTAQFRIWWHLETAGQKKNGVVGAGLGVYWTKASICLTYELNKCMSNDTMPFDSTTYEFYDPFRVPSIAPEASADC